MPEFRKIKGIPRKEALPMGTLVPMFVRARGLSAELNTQRVFAAWDEVSGIKDFTLRKFYRDGKLFVTISSSMVRRSFLLYFTGRLLGTSPVPRRTAIKSASVVLRSKSLPSKSHTD